MSLTVLSSLLLAGAALPAADRAAIDSRVQGIFRTYTLPASPTPVWDKPIFSAETAALIAHWKRVMPADEPDALNDGDWFCLCQDYDQKGFSATPSPARLLRGGAAEVRVRVNLGFGEVRDERLVLKKGPGGAWLIDDLFARPDFPRGLKAKLRETIAEDEALRKGAR